jgi:hypothetical protein
MEYPVLSVCRSGLSNTAAWWSMAIVALEGVFLERVWWFAMLLSAGRTIGSRRSMSDHHKLLAAPVRSITASVPKHVDCEVRLVESPWKA